MDSSYSSNLVHCPRYEQRKGYARMHACKKDITIDVGSTAYPTILFRFLIDSKADIDLKAKELVAHVYVATVVMRKITWNRMEENLEVSSVPDIETLKSGWVTIHFTPPLSAFKSDFATDWTLRGILVFSSNIGDITKRFSVDFRAKKEEIQRVLEKYPNLT